MSKSTTLLVILDGWGIETRRQTDNPITPQNAPNYFSLLKKYPNVQLQASGEAVGLFRGQEGNSEAGHINLGAGRVVKQDAVYISDAIADGTFFKNNAFHQALHHIKKYNTAVHLMGLLSNHNSAHSCPEHLYALLDFLHKEKIKKVFLHLFTDGRDSGQHDATHHLRLLKTHFNGTEKIATVMGRFYSMDRNKVWPRTQLAYEAIINGTSKHLAATAEEALSFAYNRLETDEFISPTVITQNNKPIGTVNDNDIIIFFNLRSDRARQLTKTFVQPSFEKENPNSFRRSHLPKNTRFVAMTDFGPDLPGVLTAYPSRDVKNSLVQFLCPRKQLYVAESEKFAHITYFFNGGYAKHFCDEKWVKVPTPIVSNFARRPVMNGHGVTKAVTAGLRSRKYDFIACNFANADMVGHTGDFEAGKIAVHSLDKQIGHIVEVAKQTNAKVVITADHGNIEEMRNMKTDEVDTEHSTNPVPCIIINDGKKIKRHRGKLADVAPTILNLMGLKPPKEMSGKSLI